jgi:predicted GNAT superfamily acetyltransferase
MVNEVNRAAPDCPRSEEPRLNLTHPCLLVEVPPDIQAMKTADLTSARAWRMVTRRIFETYFERGYTVTEFATGLLAGQRRNFYLMEADFEDRTP